MLALLFGAQFARATIMREDIGELKIHDLLLRPNFMLEEPRKGSFSIGESSFALRWELEEKYKGVIRIGPRSLINPTARYTNTVNNDITLVEAYAQYDDVYGVFRMGMLPVGFGYEGRLWERQLIFPRSMLYAKRAMALRDIGVSYDISHNNWYTGFVVSNGNSDTNVDGRTWYTARFGYKGEMFDVGAAGQAGSTLPISTTASQDTLAGVDPTQSERWRIGGLYADIAQKDWEIVAEGYLGQLQQQQTTRYASGHLDLSYLWTKRFSTHVRYDYFNNNMETSNQGETQISLALMFSNLTHSSNLILVGTKDIVQGAEVAHNAVMLIWSLSPSGIVRF
jgi:hypothetical protein